MDEEQFMNLILAVLIVLGIFVIIYNVTSSTNNNEKLCEQYNFSYDKYDKRCYILNETEFITKAIIVKIDCSFFKCERYLEFMG